MDRPLCRLCQTRHGSREPHVWPKGSAVPAKQAVPSQPSVTGRAVSGVGTQPGRPLPMPPRVGTQDHTEVAALKARITELEAEVASLKAAAELTERRRKSNRDKMAARRAGARP